MNEIDFKTKYEQEQPILYAWGSYVRDKIISAIELTKDIKVFLKMPVEPRVKDLNSLIEKAFYRNKNYSDPYNDITDKVGIRFVVLLTNEINEICKIIENEASWIYSKDLDYEQIISKNPTTFYYQSDHYIVRSKLNFRYKGVDIPQNLPCEIQIRTLLQHAYSELSHDNIYKPKTLAKPEVHRMVARSMALIETTDSIFLEVSKTMNSEQVRFDEILPELNKLYLDIAKPEYERKLNEYIFDGLQELFGGVEVVAEVDKFINNNAYIKEAILKKYNQNLLYRQPIILLVFYLIDQNTSKVRHLWPLTEKELKPLYIDLGITLN
jgi:ppGpp synthetase/RelA/SpoT-type nucleotidyltranferase